MMGVGRSFVREPQALADDAPSETAAAETGTIGLYSLRPDLRRRVEETLKDIIPGARPATPLRLRRLVLLARRVPQTCHRVRRATQEGLRGGLHRLKNSHGIGARHFRHSRDVAIGHDLYQVIGLELNHPEAKCH